MLGFIVSIEFFCSSPSVPLPMCPGCLQIPERLCNNPIYHDVQIIECHIIDHLCNTLSPDTEAHNGCFCLKNDSSKLLTCGMVSLEHALADGSNLLRPFPTYLTIELAVPLPMNNSPHSDGNIWQLLAPSHSTFR